MNKKKWIWQQDDYPDFKYDTALLEPILLNIKYHQGLLDGIYASIHEDDLVKTQLEILTEDALNTSAIEGEILNRDSVRSSIAKKIGIETSMPDSSTISTDGLIDILIDATTDHAKPITLERIFGWHNALFPLGFSSHSKINVATFRGDEEMQIVSGYIGKEKIHYVAPDRKILEDEMDQFLRWLDDDSDLSIIKAGIAHLWFVIIHPLDDGNGRLARVICDHVLARDARQPLRLYSISQSIKKDRQGYYDILEKTTTGDVNITDWLIWFLETTLDALKQAQVTIGHILEKTRFWDRHRNTILNEKQIKVLNRLLDVGKGNFEGGMNTRKYAAITKTSKPTASRDLKYLLEKRCIIQMEGTSGRNISYVVLI